MKIGDFSTENNHNNIDSKKRKLQKNYIDFKNDSFVITCKQTVFKRVPEVVHQNFSKIGLN